MDYILLNFLPILLATVAGFAFGAVYYILLKRPYAQASGTDETHRRSLSTYGVVFAAEFWLAAILAGALILAPSEASPAEMAVGSAMLIWVGFVMPVTVVNARLALRPWSLALIDSLHWLGVMVVQAAVMLLVGVGAPA